jgi:multidrug resistance protein, MATE family
MSEAKRVSRQAILLGLMMMSASAVVFLFLGSTIAGSMTERSAQARPQIVDLTAQLLLIAAAFQFADGTQNIAMGALRGLKRTRSTMVIGAIGYWGVGLPVGWFFGSVRQLGAQGAWWGLLAGLYATAILLVVRLEYVTSRPRSRGHVATT